MCACTERYSPSFSERIIERTGTQTMLYIICTMLSSVDLAHYGVSRAKNWVSVDCGTCCCCCCVVLSPRLTSKVISGRSVNLTTLFLGRLRPPTRLTSTLCSYFRQ